jgi:type 1 fimbria pilin
MVTLHNCFSGPGTYNILYKRVVPATLNITDTVLDLPNKLTGTGGAIEANCDCPGNMAASSTVYSTTFAGSPLNPGVSGYGYLTENIDINIVGSTDAINSPDGSGLYDLPIDTYPTPMSSMPIKNDTRIKTTESSASVCSSTTHPSGGSLTKRQFKWNAIGATFYVKKPILGEEIIPNTLVAQNYACLYFNSGGGCTIADAQQVSNIWLSGSLAAPLSCTINAGGTIEVELGNIITSQFTSQGNPPSGYTLKNVDITYHCDGPATANSNKIRLTLIADQGVADSSDNLIAKMLNRDDLGVRMYDKDDNNIVLDGTADFPVTLDEQGNGSISMKAAPVSTTNARPEPGKFEGNVTVKMDLR